MGINYQILNSHTLPSSSSTWNPTLGRVTHGVHCGNSKGLEPSNPPPISNPFDKYSKSSYREEGGRSKSTSVDKSIVSIREAGKVQGVGSTLPVVVKREAVT